MNGLDYYAGLLEDRQRIVLFRDAIRAVVQRGDRVVEIGSGLGTYALMAAQAGAAQVDAIDSNPVAVAYARELGVGRQVNLVEADAQRVTPRWRADVVIFEDFGGFGFFPGIRALLDHVHRKLATPRARYLPAEVEGWLAPVDVALDAPLRGGDDLPFEAERFALFGRRVLSDVSSRKVDAKRLVGPGARVGSFVVARDLPERVELGGRLRVARSARATGLAGWTRMKMPGGGSIDNGPKRKESAWGTVVFPFDRPLALKKGEALEVSVEAAFGPGPKGLIWRWSASGKAGSREGCSVNAMAGDLDLLRRGSSDQVPRRGPEAALIVKLLKAADGRRTAAEIARAVGADESEVVELLERLRGWGLR